MEWAAPLLGFIFEARFWYPFWYYKGWVFLFQEVAGYHSRPSLYLPSIPLRSLYLGALQFQNIDPPHHSHPIDPQIRRHFCFVLFWEMSRWDLPF